MEIRPIHMQRLEQLASRQGVKRFARHGILNGLLGEKKSRRLNTTTFRSSRERVSNYLAGHRHPAECQGATEWVDRRG